MKVSEFVLYGRLPKIEKDNVHRISESVTDSDSETDVSRVGLYNICRNIKYRMKHEKAVRPCFQYE